MTFNELLKNYNDIRYQIKRCISRQQELRELYSYPRRPVSEIHTTSKGDTMLNYVDKLAELEQEQVQLENTLFCIRNDIEQVLNNIADYNARRIVELRIFYDNRKPTWTKIGGKIGYSGDHVRRIFRESIKII